MTHKTYFALARKPPSSTTTLTNPLSQPSENPLVQTSSHQILWHNNLTLPPITLMLSIQRLHRRTHAAQSLSARTPANINSGSGSVHWWMSSMARGLRKERSTARIRGHGVLLLLLLVVGHDKRLP
jgi:hypothetical protein